MNSNFSFFDVNDNLVVIIGYATDHTLSNHAGKLMCGVVELKKVLLQDQVLFIQRLVLPFSSKILFAKFNHDNQDLMVVFKEGEKLMKKIMSIHDGNINKQDYVCILDEDCPLQKPLGEYQMVCHESESLSKNL